MAAPPIRILEKYLFSHSVQQIFAKSMVAIHKSINLLKVFYERNIHRFQRGRFFRKDFVSAIYKFSIYLSYKNVFRIIFIYVNF